MSVTISGRIYAGGVLIRATAYVPPTPPDWWNLTPSPVAATMPKPTSSTLITDRPIPADNNWWDLTPTPVTATMSKPTSSTLITDRPIPADNNWWDLTPTPVTATMSKPTSSIEII